MGPRGTVLLFPRRWPTIFFTFRYRRLIFLFPNTHLPREFPTSALSFSLPSLSSGAFYPKRPTVSKTPDFPDISINFPDKGLLFYGRILDVPVLLPGRKSALKNERCGEKKGSNRRKGEKIKKRGKKKRNNDSRQLIFVSFCLLYARQLPLLHPSEPYYILGRIIFLSSTVTSVVCLFFCLLYYAV